MARACVLEVFGAVLLVSVNSPPQKQLADLGYTSCLGITDFPQTPFELRIDSNTQEHFSRHRQIIAIETGL
jgi:hypothetical protein